MQAGPITRHDFAVFATARTSPPARPVGDAHAPTPVTPATRRDYATFLAHENAANAAERPTYADLLEARRTALVEATRRAAGVEALRLTPPTDYRAPASAKSEDAIASSPTSPWRAIEAAYSVRAETVASTGSLIDILL